MKSKLDKKALMVRIDIKRKDMYRKAKKLGLSHPLVVSISQELDQLLNRYQEKYNNQNINSLKNRLVS
ncbi:Spo0E family sporulation regulatory protein-aspartic acid phosphatase [Psychrobacillus sp. PGGUH221]|uniref:Spo0E family sporulation regulatory protein-aspartic acid phosphatase n=1 Tax=Psychrobacillus sp. PGGUH221 TaxID=3020058 RepID=UPI0035C782F1